MLNIWSDFSKVTHYSLSEGCRIILSNAFHQNLLNWLSLLLRKINIVNVYTFSCCIL